MKINSAFLKPTRWVEPSEKEILLISDLIGKTPQGEFTIVVCDNSGNPLVIENAPFFYDGTPMPTRYWLVDPDLVAKISRLESAGGVKQVQVQIDLETIQKIHDRYEQDRNLLIDNDFIGPKPSGGVGGTRRGVKCLHTHVANYLVTGNDEVGKWTIERIGANG